MVMGYFIGNISKRIEIISNFCKRLHTPSYEYSRVPITRHGMFIRHTPCIWPDTFTKRWDMMFNRIRTKRKRAVPFNWIPLFWSVSILRGVFPYEPLLVFGSCHSKWQLWLIFHPIHFQSCEPLLLFSTWHQRSGEPLRLFSTPLLIGTREYLWA